MSEHVKPEHSLALMALAQGDPERVEAERHAESCAACRAALDEGLSMLSMVDAFAELPQVAPALKSRVRATALAEAPKPARVIPKWSLLFGALLSALLAVFEAQPGELAPALGLHCIAIENLMAVAPFAVAAWLGMRGVIALEPLNLATVSMAGALVGQLVLHFRCASHATSHLFAFHVLGVVLATALGYIAASGLARVRNR